MVKYGLLPGFCNAGDAHVDIGYLVPCGVICDTGFGQVKDSLEGTHGLCGGVAVDSVHHKKRNGREIAGNAV